MNLFFKILAGIMQIFIIVEATMKGANDQTIMWAIYSLMFYHFSNEFAKEDR